VPELVVSLVQRPRESPANTAPAHPALRIDAIPRAERLRLPGSNWLFAKLYGPSDGQDELIAGAVRNLGEFAVGSGLADRWYFLRYADPEPHLRLRFAGEPDRLLRDLLPRICDWADELVSTGSCRRLSFDTYEREIERYGGVEAMATVEAVFAADSAAVADILHLARTTPSPPDRTTLAMQSVDSLLDELGLDAAVRTALYRDGVSNRRASAEEYRHRQQTLRRLLGEAFDRQDEPELARILRARRAALGGPAADLRGLARAGRLAAPIDVICRSIVHLHCNRLLGSEPPSEQLVLGLLLRTREGLERAPFT
jgi:thiopeptide-type bacteriocin biosynthesis protein